MKIIKKLNLRKIKTTHGNKDDKVSVLKFTVLPVNAKPGNVITIRMTIKNVSDKQLKGVPWQIVKDKEILDRGIRYNLSPGDSFRVSTTWTASKGSHFFYGDADPGNVLKEPKIKQFNNLPQGADIKVK
jgi:hypothetical protein